MVRPPRLSSVCRAFWRSASLPAPSPPSRPSLRSQLKSPTPFVFAAIGFFFNADSPRGWTPFISATLCSFLRFFFSNAQKKSLAPFVFVAFIFVLFFLTNAFLSQYSFEFSFQFAFALGLRLLFFLIYKTQTTRLYPVKRTWHDTKYNKVFEGKK